MLKIFKSRKELKMSGVGVQKTLCIKFGSNFTLLWHFWKKVLNLLLNLYNILSKLYNNMSSFLSRLLNLPKFVWAVVMFLVFGGLAFVIFYIINAQLNNKKVYKNYPTLPEYAALINFTSDPNNERLVNMMYKTSTSASQDVLSNLTISSLGVIIGMFCFLIGVLIGVLIFLFQMMVQNQNDRFAMLEKEFRQGHSTNIPLLPITTTSTFVPFTCQVPTFSMPILPTPTIATTTLVFTTGSTMFSALSAPPFILQTVSSSSLARASFFRLNKDSEDKVVLQPPITKV